MIFYVLASITILYFLFAFWSERIKKIVGRKICAICAAVSLTWSGLLLLRLIGFKIEPLIIAILMGQSIVGIMYKAEEYFKEKKLEKFWLVRILTIVGGTLLIYWLLKANYLLTFLLLIGGGILLIFVLSTASGKEVENQPKSKERRKAISKLEKMMEDCC